MQAKAIVSGAHPWLCPGRPGAVSRLQSRAIRRHCLSDTCVFRMRFFSHAQGVVLRPFSAAHE